MRKAILMDYTGTIIQEDGPDVEELIKRCYKNSDIESPEKMVAYWWRLIKKYESNSYGESFKTEDEIVDKILKTCEKEIHLKEDLAQLHRLCQRFWMYAPIFEDVKEFFDKCTVPIYVVTNNGMEYVQTAMQKNDLHPAGIVCGDMAKAYKPHRELFEKALEISGCKAEDVIHVGDSVASDVKGAIAAGIYPVLLDRKKEKNLEGIAVIHSLLELIDREI